MLPALSALEQGYEVYVVSDASGGVSPLAHEHAVQRMTAAGAVPVTWIQVLLELQRDWARTETYLPVMDVIKEHAGAYGLGVVYAQTMINEHAAG
ncbi:nicotinamidase-related amidase [Kitasatospora sp. GP82]|nr:nicotinamidase-related amidase [Kitasatospora sp. GP82]